MTFTNFQKTVCLIAALFVVGNVGCANKRKVYVDPDAPAPLGTQTDSIFEMQEHNAEAAKFIVYEHEFELPTFADGKTSGGWKLNSYGEDHLKQIAVSLSRGAMFPVVVERSRISPDADTTYQYPIHFNAQLDENRRMVIVAALQSMGIQDADEVVVIAPSFAEGITGREGQRAYTQGIMGAGGGAAGAGRFSSGFGGIGGVF